jgi:hypothetical protein
MQAAKNHRKHRTYRMYGGRSMSMSLTTKSLCTLVFALALGAGVAGCDDDEPKTPDAGTGGSGGATGGSGGATGGTGGATGGSGGATGGTGGATGGRGGATGGSGGATGGTGGSGTSDAGDMAMGPDTNTTTDTAPATDMDPPEEPECMDVCPALFAAASPCEIPEDTMCTSSPEATAASIVTNNFCLANGVKVILTYHEDNDFPKTYKTSKNGTVCYTVDETGNETASTLTWKNAAGAVIATGQRTMNSDKLTVTCTATNKTTDVSNLNCPGIDDGEPAEAGGLECPTNASCVP